MAIKTDIRNAIRDRKAAGNGMPTHLILSCDGADIVKASGWSGDINETFCDLHVIVLTDQSELFTLSGVA